MGESKDRPELERQLEQSKRMAASVTDPLTNERLQQLIRDLEDQLRRRATALGDVRRTAAMPPCQFWI